MRFSFSNQSFFDAIRKGDARRVETFVKSSPNLINQHEKSTNMLPVQLAAYAGQLEVVKLLVDRGANPTQGNRPNRMQTHALYYAEQQGHTDVVEFIWDWLAKNRRHTKEAQKLCEAIKAGNISLVERLLEDDNTLANATEFGNASGLPGGHSVLNFAILNDSAESVERLIAHGADLKNPDRSPIHMALSFLVGVGHRPGLDKETEVEKRMEIVELLLKAGVKRDLWVESCLGNLAEVQAMVKTDPDSVNRSVNPSEASGGLGMDHFPLTGAVAGQHIDVAKYLLEQGADPDTPFHLNGYNHLDHGAPLEIAVRNQNMELVKLLLEHGANPDTSRHACSNAMQTAIHSGNNELINLLLRKGASIGFDGQLDLEWSNGQNILLQAAYLQMDPPPARDLPLRFIRSATFNGSPHLVELSLNKLDSVPEKMQFELFQNLIEMWSIYVGNVKGVNANDYFECMKLLLDFGLDPNAVNEQGETCLHRLCSNTSYPKEEDRLEFAGMLLAKGADPNRRDKIIPASALDLARKNGWEQLSILMTRQDS